MVVYVADNYTTGERIMSYDRDAFRKVVTEAFGPRLEDEVQTFSFDMGNVEILEEIRNAAKNQDYRAIAVLNYWKENGGE